MFTRPTRVLPAALTAAVLCAGVIAALPASAATNPVAPWEPDAQAVGTITFYDSSGAVKTSGRTDQAPFAAYAVGSKSPRAGDAQAQLLFANPMPGTKVTPSFFREQVGSYSQLPLTNGPAALQTTSKTQPVVAGFDNDETLDHFETDSKISTQDGYKNVVQVRLRTADSAGQPTAMYDDADLLINPSTHTWTQIYPDTGVAACAPFTDVTSANPFCDDIAFLKAQGITTGNADGSFGPTMNVSRQAIAAFLYRYEHPGVTAAVCTTKPFTDVAIASPFCADITALKAEGAINGYADGGFHPTAAVSRQATAAFLFRLANPGETAPACTTAAFNDVPASSQFCGDINYLVNEKVTTGYADGGFHPLSDVSRQAIAAFLHRLYNATHA